LTGTSEEDGRPAVRPSVACARAWPVVRPSSAACRRGRRAALLHHDAASDLLDGAAVQASGGQPPRRRSSVAPRQPTCRGAPPPPTDLLHGARAPPRLHARHTCHLLDLRPRRPRTAPSRLHLTPRDRPHSTTRTAAAPAACPSFTSATRAAGTAHGAAQLATAGGPSTRSSVRSLSTTARPATQRLPLLPAGSSIASCACGMRSAAGRHLGPCVFRGAVDGRLLV
jgi:hypothetical protein